MDKNINTLDYILDKYHIDPSTGTQFNLPGGRGPGGLISLWHVLGFKTGAEIGVESGRYSRSICKHNPSLKLYLVDSWAAYPGWDHVTQEHWEVLYNDTIARTNEYDCEIIRSFSMDAIKEFGDESLDFVYIDANHDYKHVTEDITEWSKKVRRGGIISGHDYKISKVGTVNNTIEAVNDFTSAQNIKPWFIWVGESAPSWMWVKP